MSRESVRIAMLSIVPSTEVKQEHDEVLSACIASLFTHVPHMSHAGKHANISRCSLRVRADMMWQIVRIGPFTTSGGGEAAFGHAENAWPLASDPLVDGFTTVRAAFGAVTDATGRVIEPQIIHLHHHMLYHQRYDPAIERTQFLYWGSEVDRKMFEYPAGTGQLLLDPILHIDSMYNDLRPADSTLISLFFEVALRLSRARPCYQLKMIALYGPDSYLPIIPDGVIEHHQIENPRRLSSASNSSEFAYNMWPVTQGSMKVPKWPVAWWKAAPFEFDGYLVWAHLHAHRLAETRVRAIAATPEQIGLNIGEHVMPSENSPLQLKETVREFESKLSFGSKAGCKSYRTGSALIDGVRQERSDGFRCSEWAFVEGDVRTVLCSMQTPEFYPEAVLGQHCQLYMLAIAESHKQVAFLEQVGVNVLTEWSPLRLTWDNFFEARKEGVLKIFLLSRP